MNGKVKGLPTSEASAEAIRLPRRIQAMVRAMIVCTPTKGVKATNTPTAAPMAMA